MNWTVTNLAIQFVAGVVGAHLVALILKDHAFGFFGHTIAGAIGGTLSGTFLQSLAVTMVTAGGSMNEPTAVENAVIQVFTGAAAGGCCMMSGGLVKQLLDERKAQKNQVDD